MSQFVESFWQFNRAWLVLTTFPLPNWWSKKLIIACFFSTTLLQQPEKIVFPVDLSTCDWMTIFFSFMMEVQSCHDFGKRGSSDVSGVARWVGPFQPFILTGKFQFDSIYIDILCVQHFWANIKGKFSNRKKNVEMFWHNDIFM